ncbi:2-iminobutanoate/2-iminopropanoate deaminase [Vanrija pseudolonga]|uniref:2-iminobutanoate/2-iminopropanoate deaminase n=1 Tax=Vanrija pseudolonga TaxID=143232 RepID=A0AAF1BPB7_9TREE|nr:2-iminobutanoate/2-iminopropanoate deaminase [Vanrija pseudolonga]
MPFPTTNYPGAGDLMAASGLCQAVRVGNVVHLSGQGGWDAGLKVDADPKAQIEQALKNVEAALRGAGASGLKDVFKFTVFVTGEFDTFATPLIERLNEIYAAAIPAMSVIGVNNLWLGMGIEIEAQAWVGNEAAKANL